MNVKMWINALNVIPRITKAEWDQLDIISKWLISTRAALLSMTFTAAAIAGLLAYRDGSFHLGRWILLAIGLVFAHATNNMLNDYTDFRRGVDKDNYFRTQYGPQPMQQGLMTSRQTFLYIAVTALISLIAGIPLLVFGGWIAVGLLIAGTFFLLFYTYPLKYIGLGELTVILVWGPLMIGGGYYVITGNWDWNTVIASLPFAFGATTVLFGKHIDKLPFDKAKNIHTFPVIIGERNARFTALALMALQYLSIIYLVWIGYFTPAMLIIVVAVIALPTVVRMYLQPKPESMPEGFRQDVWPLWFSAAAFYHVRYYGAFFMLGLVLDILFRKLF